MLHVYVQHWSLSSFLAGLDKLHVIFERRSNVISFECSLMRAQYFAFRWATKSATQYPWRLCIASNRLTLPRAVKAKGAVHALMELLVVTPVYETTSCRTATKTNTWRAKWTSLFPSQTSHVRPLQEQEEHHRFWGQAQQVK